MKDMKDFSMKNLLFPVALLAIVIAGWLVLREADDADKTVSETEVAVSDNESSEASSSDSEQQSSNVVELAQATDSLSTLVSAVVTADLVETLSGEGPFTVFAPTNDAFNALLTNLGITTDELLARDDLAGILTYHVVSGEVLSGDLTDGMVVTTVQGNTLTVNVGDTVTITDTAGNVATVTAADVDASNGVVHIIDSVVLP